ncbi:helix-turn-helix domain-containing protein [Aquidulcibacter sp.]|jgi:TetR/AcrR family transcriptional repressor of nem operon|uniref:helix-turn-helix domain-containing protein n=1 Tax=Aquidulcibacter sp. TaxID=2052990 RepID=UPI0035067367
MKLFWRNGYRASSLSDLLDEMKIGRGSFYAAFRDNRHLFLECLNPLNLCRRHSVCWLIRTL